MNILQIVQKPQRRGAEVFALQLSGQLREAGHDVRTAYLYAHEQPGGLRPSEHDKMLAGRERHYFERIPGIHPWLAWRLRRLVEEVQPDVVQVNGGRAVKYGAAVASAQRHRSWVLIYRNIGQPQDWVRGWRHSLYSRLVMPHVDGVVGVSGSTLQGVRDWYRLSVPTVRIPCAVETATAAPTIARDEIRRQAQTPLSAPVIVWVGSLTPEKRLDRLVRAVHAVQRRIPDVHLWIVGGGPVRHSLEQQVRASSLAACVRFLGVQGHVANYMSAGDLVTLTSDTEGMPAVLLEAGLLGLAVVATRVGGVSECVLDGATGILVQREDEDALACALHDLLRCPDRRRRLGTTARAWIEQNFTMRQIAQQYAAFYRRVLAG